MVLSVSSRKKRLLMRKSWLARRIAALVYDTFLILALIFATGAVVLALRGGVMPPVNTSWYSLLLAAVPVAFYLWFWLHGGQTLGMRAWGLTLRGASGAELAAPACALRLGIACLSLAAGGLGFLWTLVPPKHRSWHGLASGTEIDYAPRQKKRTD